MEEDKFTNTYVPVQVSDRDCYSRSAAKQRLESNCKFPDKHQTPPSSNTSHVKADEASHCQLTGFSSSLSPGARTAERCQTPQLAGCHWLQESGTAATEIGPCRRCYVGKLF